MSGRVLAQPAIAFGVRIIPPRRPIAGTAGASAAEPMKETVLPNPAVESADIEAEVASRVAAAVETLREQLRVEISARDEARMNAAADEARAAAREQGYADGYGAGMREAGMERDQATAQWSALLAAIESAHAESLAATQERAIAVGMAAAARILGERLVTAEGVQAMVATVLREVRADEKVTVLLSARDFERVQAAGVLASSVRVAVEVDDAVEPGGCRVTTPAGSLEARLREQWEVLSAALLASKGEA